MDLHRLFRAVEYPTQGRGSIRARQLTYVAVGGEKHVEFGAQATHQTSECGAHVLHLRSHSGRRIADNDVTQCSRRKLRGKAKAIDNHHRLQVVVENGRQHGVFEAADHHHFVDEAVVVTAQAAEAVADIRPGGALAGSNHENFEIGLTTLSVADGGRQKIR